MILLDNESLYYLLYSCTNLIFGENFSCRYGPEYPEPIRLQDFLINHISRNNHWHSLVFCKLIQIHIKQNLIKFFLVGHSQKWMWLFWSWHFKIGCISRMNWWDRCKFIKAKSYISDFDWVWSNIDMVF